MPWSSISELKASDTYQKSDTLKKFPEFRLRRFLEIFNTIHDKKMAAGATKEEADATAFAMAYGAAKRFQPTPKGATLEPQRHYFATMMPLQFSRGGEVEDMSFDYLQANLATINAAVAGNAFNLDHQHTEPLGAIHRLLPISEVPAEARAKLASQTPFVTEASYFEGTPDSLKAIRTISAEWLEVNRSDGRTEVLLPDSFAIVTTDPATDETLGVQKLANANQTEIGNMDENAAEKTANVLNAAKRNKLPPHEFACPEDRSFPIDSPERVRAALSRINQPHQSKCSKDAMLAKIHAAAKHFGIEVAGAKKASVTTAKGYQPNADSMHQESHDMADQPDDSKNAPGPEVGALTEKVASLSTDLELMKKAKDTAEGKYATLQADFAAATGRIAALEKISQSAAAEAAVDKGIEAGKLATDAKPYWVQEYLERGAEKFATTLANLPVNHLGVARPKAAMALANDSGANAAIERMSKGVKASLTNGRAN